MNPMVLSLSQIHPTLSPNPIQNLSQTQNQTQNQKRQRSLRQHASQSRLNPTGQSPTLSQC